MNGFDEFIKAALIIFAAIITLMLALTHLERTLTEHSNDESS